MHGISTWLGIFFLSSILVVITNAIVDLAYTMIDPRIELARGRSNARAARSCKRRLGSFRRNPGALVGMTILGCVILLAVAAPVCIPTIPPDGRKTARQPFDEFPFGTDMLGRDIAAGIAHGARISLLVGVVATLVIVTLGP